MVHIVCAGRAGRGSQFRLGTPTISLMECLVRD